MSSALRSFFIFTLLLCLVLGLSLAACGGSGDTTTDEGNEGATASDTLVMLTTGEPSSFHPNFKSDDYAWPINQNIFNRLVKLGPNDNVVLDLAESYEFSEDGLKLTFHLHDGVKWHDGEAFTSADVKWTYDTMLAENWSKADNIRNIDSIECPDDLTVVMNLKTPDVSIISKLSWYGTFILPKHLYEGQDTATCEYNMNPVGTGPYKFVEYNKGVSVTLVANEEFFGGAPKTKNLIFSIIPDPETYYQAFLNEEVDYIGSLPAQHSGDLDGDPNYSFVEALGTNRTYVTVNFQDEIFGQKVVRQAMAMGLDREGIYQRTSVGAGQVADTFLSPNFPEFVDEQYSMPERDVEGAIKLLEDAGFTRNENGYFIEATFDVFTSGTFVDIATIVAANLEEIGIKLTVNAMEMGAWQDKVLVNHDFQVTMLAGYQGPDVSGVSGRIETGASTNLAQYSNPEVDRLLALGVTQSDPAERAATYSEIQRYMAEDLPLMLLIDNGYKYVVKNGLTGMPIQEPDKLASSEYSLAQLTK